MQPESLSAQIVIPVHTVDRPIRRAVDSVLANPAAGVVLVAHNIDPTTLDLPADPRVKIVEFQDGTHFPGAAFNRGIRAASAPWVGVMGSDDWYEPGGIAAMVKRAVASDADGVIAPLRYTQAEENEVNPTTWRRKRLKAGRDRLFYRTAPLGIFRREIFEDPRFLFEDDVIAGVDQRNGVLLYTAGLNLAYFPNDPAYVVGDEAKTRVTSAVRPLAEHGKAWARLWEEPEVLRLPRKERRALAEKFVETHVLQMVASRPNVDQWLDGDFDWLSNLAGRIKALEPKLDRSFVRARAAILKELTEGTLESTLAAQKDASYADWRIPAHVGGALGRNFWVRRRAVTKASRLRDRLDRSGTQGRTGQTQ